MEESATFDPARYLMKLQGGEYLEVKWRLLWLRTEHPEAHIHTELVKHEDKLAIFKAEVSIPDRGSATGWGSETAGEFRDYIEKAETKALGRALAALGYGTQFTKEFEFGAAEMGKVVDSPIDLTSDRLPIEQLPGFGDRNGGVARQATEKQLKAIYAIARNAMHMSEGELEEKTQQLYGCLPEELSRADASRLIDALKNQELAH